MVLASFIILWAAAAAVHSTLLWFIVMNLAALYMVITYKIFDRNDLIAGVILGLICVPSNGVMGFAVILPYIASMMIFKNKRNHISLYQNGKKHTLLITLLLIFVVGGILGGINIFFAMGNIAPHPSIRIKWLFDALRAGIFEEIFFRLFFFAICVHVTKDEPLSRHQNFLTYAIMVIPHVLIHFNLQTIQVGSVIMLTLLFGLPFALMQRKTNLASAIGSHAFVDFVRFCVLGA